MKNPIPKDRRVYKQWDYDIACSTLCKCGHYRQEHWWLVCNPNFVDECVFTVCGCKDFDSYDFEDMIKEVILNNAK